LKPIDTKNEKPPKPSIYIDNMLFFPVSDVKVYNIYNNLLCVGICAIYRL